MDVSEKEWHFTATAVAARYGIRCVPKMMMSIELLLSILIETDS